MPFPHRDHEVAGAPHLPVTHDFCGDPFVCLSFVLCIYVAELGLAVTLYFTVRQSSEFIFTIRDLQKIYCKRTYINNSPSKLVSPKNVFLNSQNMLFPLIAPFWNRCNDARPKIIFTGLWVHGLWFQSTFEGLNMFIWTRFNAYLLWYIQRVTWLFYWCWNLHTTTNCYMM